jgi:hypothetical protein
VNIQLVDQWWIQLKGKVSVKLAAAFAAAVAGVVAYPSLLVGLLAYFPGGYRAFAAGGAFVLVFAVPVITALIKQPKLEAKVVEAKIVAAEEKIEERYSAPVK